jgi:pimeloyl-ACP methyl ester carboxylesterase
VKRKQRSRSSLNAFPGAGAAIALLAVALLAVGVSYQAIKTRSDARRFPQEGKSVDLGGYRLNLNCTGQGRPTVILEAGLTVPAITWRAVQREVAGFTRVCSYDRAGYDWSDPGPMPRSSAQSMKELHTLLRNAGESPPFVLVGHSYGGTNVRIYNRLYPSDVAGMVLVEPGHEDLQLPAHIQASFDATVQEQRENLRWSSFLYRMGFTRFMARNKIDDRSLSYDKQEWAYFAIQPKFNEAVASELDTLEQGKNELRSAGTLGGKPLIVLIAKDSLLDLPLPEADKAALNKTWVDLEMRLAQLSSRGKWVLITGSTHMIPIERPDAVAGAVKEVAGEATWQ